MRYCETRALIVALPVGRLQLDALLAIDAECNAQVSADPQFTRVGSTPMPAYLSDKRQRNEGIVAYLTLRDGTIAFLADRGQLFTLSFANGDRIGQLRRRGFMHPTGKAQTIKSLCSYAGVSLLEGLARDRRESSLGDRAGKIKRHPPLAVTAVSALGTVRQFATQLRALLRVREGAFFRQGSYD